MTEDSADAHRCSRPILFLNGKFYSGAVNGVHRVADRLIRELDSLATGGGPPARWDMRLLLPGGEQWAPSFKNIRLMQQRLGHSQLWEQFILPFAARNGALASFANLAPWGHGRKATMVHDAQFRLSPSSYSLKRRLGYRAMIPLGARSSDVVLSVSAYARDMLDTFGIASAGCTKVLYNGADHILEGTANPDILSLHGLRVRGYLLVFGATADYKNLKVVFEALRGVDLADIPLVLIGSSQHAMVEAGLCPPPQTLFVGTIDDAALRALYEAALALLYPSRTEGFGLPPVEAMMCGCPVVASPAGAIPEICQDAILYAGMDDPAAWREQIGRLADGQPLRHAKIASGRARASRFTWKAAGSRLADLLIPLVEGSGGRGGR